MSHLNVSFVFARAKKFKKLVFALAIKIATHPYTEQNILNSNHRYWSTKYRW